MHIFKHQHLTHGHSTSNIGVDVWFNRLYDTRWRVPMGCDDSTAVWPLDTRENEKWWAVRALSLTDQPLTTLGSTCAQSTHTLKHNTPVFCVSTQENCTHSQIKEGHAQALPQSKRVTVMCVWQWLRLARKSFEQRML